MSGDDHTGTGELDLDAIEARARAVPSGWDRWADWQHYQILGLVTPTKIDGWAHPEKRRDAMERTEAAVEHIVGMDPPTTLALVAEVRRLRAEVESFHSWDGLMALLDEHWPDDIFPTLPDDNQRDPGPRIVSLLRWVDRLRAT